MIVASAEIGIEPCLSQNHCCRQADRTGSNDPDPFGGLHPSPVYRVNRHSQILNQRGIGHLDPTRQPYQGFCGCHQVLAHASVAEHADDVCAGVAAMPFAFLAVPAMTARTQRFDGHRRAVVEKSRDFVAKHPPFGHSVIDHVKV